MAIARLARMARLPPLLRDTPFRRYWTGRTLSQVGDQVRALALPLTAVTVLHAGATAMGVLAAAGSLPALLASLHAGAWVDRRGGRRQVMLWADVGRAALLAALPALWAAGALSLPLLVGMALALGLLSVLFSVSAGTLFVALVPRERYLDAGVLLSQGRAGAFLVGPGIGGVLIQALGAPLALLADAASFVASALSLARIRPVEPPPAARGAESLFAGLAFVRRSPVLWRLWLSASTIALFKAMFSALYILYMTRALGVTPAEMGIILGPSSVGALAAASLAGRLSRRIGLGRTLILGSALYTLPMLAVPLAGGTHALVVALLFVVEGTIAAGVMTLDTVRATVQAAGIPDAVRARVLGAFTATGAGLWPVGALLAGGVAALAGLRAAMWVGAAGSVLGTAWLGSGAIVRLRAVEDIEAAPAALPARA